MREGTEILYEEKWVAMIRERQDDVALPMNLSVAVKIFQPFEYFTKHRGYSSLVEHSMFAIGSSGLMLDYIQQRTALQQSQN